MKIKLPIALRSALLAAMAFTAGTAYAAPYDPSQSPGPIGTEVSGLLVGSSATENFTINSNLTVSGDAVVGAGDRSGVTGGKGLLTLSGANVTVNGNVYAGASGVVSFPGYVTSNASGDDGTIQLNSSATLTVNGAVRLGWLDGKKGSMTVDASTVTATGQIVVGFYNEPGGLSLNTAGELTIKNGGNVTSNREVFLGSGSISVEGNSSSLTATHLEIVGKETSSVTFNGGAQGTFNEVLVGEYGNEGTMTVEGNSSRVTSNGDFQISSGRLTVINGAGITVVGDAWFGNKVSVNPLDSQDTFVLFDTNTDFTAKTLSVWKDALLTAHNSSITAESIQVVGDIDLEQSSTLKVNSNLYLDDGAQITVNQAVLVVGTATESNGTINLNVTGDPATGLNVDLGTTTVASGQLTLESTTGGTITTGDLKMTGGNLDIKESVTLEASSASVAAGTILSVENTAKVNVTGELDLHGTLSTKGELAAGTLTLNQGAGFTVDSTGKLGIGKTEINSDFVLTNTGNNGGTLGEVTLADGVSLGLSSNNSMTSLTTVGNNTVTVSGSSNQLGVVTLADGATLDLKGSNNSTTSLTTGSNNTVTVSGSGNELGAVTVGAASKLLVQGDTTVASLINNGDVSVTRKLTITGRGTDALQLNGGTTTVSGSIVGDNVVWNSANTPVTLLINGDTATQGTMLTLGGGLDADSFQVKVDLTGGLSSLSGKEVTFARNGTEAVSFSKNTSNFEFLTDGTVHERVDNENPNHIIVEQEIGSTKLVYGYTVNGGSAGESWQGTGITFDENYSNTFKVVEDSTHNAGETLQVNVVQKPTTELGSGSDTYDLVALSPSGQVDEPESVVAKNVAVTGETTSLNVSSQVVSLFDSDGTRITDIIVGTKTLQVTGDTTITGEAATGSEAMVGGLSGTIETDEGPKTADRIGELSIAAGKTLTIENSKVEVDRTISMGNASTIAATKADITIGVTGNPLILEEDVTIEVPVKRADGEVVMEQVSLSADMNQKALDNISLTLEDSTLVFNTIETQTGAGETVATNDKVVFNSANISMTQTDGETMKLGGGTAQMILNNSTVSGTGVLDNIVMNGGTLKIGNSPGIVTANRSTYSGVAIDFMIDPSMTTGGMLNNQVTGENAMMSQLNLSATTSFSGCVVNIYMETKDANDIYTGLPNSSTQYLDNLAVGTSFQFITGLENLAAGSSFILGSMPTLEDGLVWDIGQLGVDGTVSIVRGSYADAVRIANTLVSAGETVSGFGQMSRTHVYDVRLNGTNVWVNGLGTFLNHSSHNGRSGFEYNAGGYAVGADTIVNNKAIVGLAFGQSFGKHTPKAGNRFYDAGKIDMDSVMFGLYGGTSFAMKSPSDSVKLDAYASYGRFDNDSRHHSLTTGQAATASWKENAYAVGATLTHVHEVRENLFFSPFVSLDYTYADMDSFTESAAQTISYEGTAYQNLSMSVGTGLTRVYHLNGGQELSPYVSVAYVGDLVRKDAKVTSRNSTGALVERSVSPGRNAFQVNVGAGWKVTENWGARVGYTAEFRSGATDQGVTVGVNYAF